ncbi:hypothetical protein [Mycobacterium neumannii]|uniref:hypothetical protein n=1 Tax=Mycobacterium neumannii TaxID=2048551 RepID=UPI003AB5050C
MQAAAESYAPEADKHARHLAICQFEIDLTRPIRVLEIGSFYGSSLRSWQEGIPSGSTIVTIDISSKLAKIADARGVHVRIGGEPRTVIREAASEFGPFDVILDAGSLTTAHMIDFFGFLFESALREDGIYMIADSRFHPWTFYNGLSLANLGSAFMDALYGHYQIASDESRFQSSPVVVVRRAVEGA